MKKIYILLYAVFVALQLSAQDHVAQIREKLMSRDSTSVIVVAHRGDWRNFPENSLEAIDNAIKMGVDIVELDVKKTKDGELILMHDRTLDRTTTGKGLVSENTLSDIRKLNLRNGCNIRTIHKVPTLEHWPSPPHLCAAAVGMRTVYSMYPSRSSRCAVAGTPLSVIRRMAWSMVFTKMRTSFTIEMR